jgi:hypothetical protein
MPRSIKDILPPPGEIIEMDPEEIGPFLLEYLNESTKEKFNLNNIISGLVNYYEKDDSEKISTVISESWTWLEREVLIVPDPKDISSGQWYIISRKGKKLRSATDFENIISEIYYQEKTLIHYYYKRFGLFLFEEIMKQLYY